MQAIVDIFTCKNFSELVTLAADGGFGKETWLIKSLRMFVEHFHTDYPIGF
jgi:hypothetical protein